MDFLFEFFGLFFEFASALFEDSFLFRTAGWCRGSFCAAASPNTANPFAKLEVREEKKADQIAGRVDDGRAGDAEHPEDVIIEHPADEAAGAVRGDGNARLADKGGRIIFMRNANEMKPAHARDD